MKRLKLKRVIVNFKDGIKWDFELFGPEEYIETFANTIKGKEHFHITIHNMPHQHEVDYEERYTFNMDDIESIIQEWR